MLLAIGTDAKLNFQDFINPLGIGLSFGFPHDLADEKAKYLFFAVLIIRYFLGVFGKDFLNDLLNFRGIGDLNESFLLNDGFGRLAGTGHFIKNGLGDFAADNVSVDQFQQRGKCLGRNRGLLNVFAFGV